MTIAVDPAIIRAAENPMIAAGAPDQLMQQAAKHLASAIRTVAEKHRCHRVVVAAGGGGNGGDGLYAGGYLAENGYSVSAICWHPSGKLHESAAQAARQAGCAVHIRDALDETLSSADGFVLVDAIQGLGSSPLSLQDAVDWARLAGSASAVVAVDLPTGVCASTGAAPSPHTLANGQELAAHVSADYTVTFGALRTAHAVSPDCGETVLADIYGPAGESLFEAVVDETLSRSTAESAAAADGSAALLLNSIDCFVAVNHTSWEDPLSRVARHVLQSFEPKPTDHKYSGGVVGVVAGSGKYPGAAVLSSLAAAKTTPSLVRYFGECAAEVVRAVPELIVNDKADPETLSRASDQVAAWVFGPGVGLTSESEAALAALLRGERPLLIDADGLTLLAGSVELRQLLRERTAVTLLTPHDGEFNRVSAAVSADLAADLAADRNAPIENTSTQSNLDEDVKADRFDLQTDRVSAIRSLAKQLGVTVLLKGRKTLVCYPLGEVTSVDAGHSWAATAGSGDVLAGLLGALLAKDAGVDVSGTVFFPENTTAYPQLTVAAGVSVHARAAWLAAQTPYGAAPITASDIAKTIPAAIADSSR